MENTELHGVVSVYLGVLCASVVFQDAVNKQI